MVLRSTTYPSHQSWVLKGHPQCGLGMSTFCGMGVGIEGALTGIGMLGGTQQVHFQALAH